MAQTAEKPLRIVVVEQDDCFLAQCLEFDIAAHGQTQDEAVRAFGHAYIRHILVARHLHVQPFIQLQRAPEEFWDLWQTRSAAGKMPTRVQMPTFTVQDRDRLDHSPAWRTKITHMFRRKRQGVEPSASFPHAAQMLGA